MPLKTKTTYDIQPAFLFSALLTIILLPIQWVLAWMIATSIHELSHIAWMRMLNVRILHVQLNYMGATIVTEPMHPAKDLCSALAGPVGGCTLLFFSNIWPELAICAMVQSIFNILPFYPLDGGRVLYNLFILLLGRSGARRTTLILDIVALTVLTILSIGLQLLYHCGTILGFLTLLLFFQYRKAKYALQSI